MNNPQFGDTEDVYQYKDGRPDDIVQRTFRKGVEVKREHWQRETVIVDGKAQAGAIILAGTEKVYSGEWLSCNFDVVPHKSGGMFVTTRWRVAYHE